MKTALTIALCLGLLSVTTGAGAADVLTGKNHMTLYTFDKDSNGKSACAVQCAAIWPPASTQDATGKDLGEIARDDGSKQLAYRGQPLYYYINDRKPGDVTGDNVNNVWHVVTPGGNVKRSESSYSSDNYKY